MNFLAHLYLAERTPESVVGNLLADFVNGEYRDHYSEAISRGIFTHRQVDRFTDSHPVFLQSVRRIPDDFRLLKGIMIDVFYDHFLAKNWKDYSDISLESFCDYAYGILLDYRPSAPLKMRKMIPLMIKHNWLLSYREISGIGMALKGLSGRLSRRNNLGESVIELERNYRELEEDFRKFFPELIEFVRQLNA